MADQAEFAPYRHVINWVSSVQMKPKNVTRRPELERYKKLLQETSEPNCGRIRELKERIQKKTFFSKEAIEEAAERLASRFFGKE